MTSIGLVLHGTLLLICAGAVAAAFLLSPDGAGLAETANTAAGPPMPFIALEPTALVFAALAAVAELAFCTALTKLPRLRCALESSPVETPADADMALLIFRHGTSRAAAAAAMPVTMKDIGLGAGASVRA